MKTFVLLISLMVLGFGCAKKDDTTAVAMNGPCYDQATGRYTGQNTCAVGVNNTNNGYTYVNGNCVQTATNQIYPAQYCQQNTNGYPQQQQQCYGSYIYIQNGYSQIVQCTGANCRGYTLTSQTTNQQVMCY
ncbi:MAG: hypothetical protein WA160_00605 [Pseudobdellovibrio sp.]